MSVETVTLGCRLNFAESETIARVAPADEDWVVVNSCAVTNEAVRQTRQAIRRARRARPDARILVTGCAAELDPGAFAAMPEVDRVVANAEKLDPRSFVLSEVEGRATTAGAAPFDYAPAGLRSGRTGGKSDEPASDVMPPAPSGLVHKVKGFVAVQTGCDHRCTFCSIWQARGASRSLPFEAIRDAITAEIDRGAKEIVLTGVDITDYAGGLGRLCQRLLAAEPRLARLRLSSLDGVEIDGALFELIAGEPRLMPHFHLSLQAGDDMILKRMKRRHSRADAVRTVERIKAARADATIGADLIAGFPTESEEMALNSLRLLDDCDIVAAHIFPFSPRPNTPAARMPQLPSELVRARAARLRNAAADRRSKWLGSLIGSAEPVLVEGDGTGHTDTFAPVAVEGAVRGEVGTVRITGRAGELLTGAWA
ncbi:MAG TPA: MiaB/RimO family radical SAM methylthiotransferase [Sphingomicrobium sp.]|nr:MiaB/RimO family radical SAM methylthiotransferase [Sphingomicrobium sp.]